MTKTPSGREAGRGAAEAESAHAARPAHESLTARDALWLAVPAAAGLAARLWGLGDQVLADDEIWAPTAVAELTVREILTHFGREDYSLPLTALARWLADLGVPASEWTLRAPSVLASILMLTVVPLLVARQFGRVAGAACAGLVAASPLLVLYARLSRPYALALALATIAALAFVDGWARPRRAPFFAWAVLGALAVWLLPVVAPFVAGPALAAPIAAVAGRSRGSRTRLRYVIEAGAVAGALVAAAFLPALRSFVTVLAAKADSREPGDEVLERAALLLAGTPIRPAALALAALATVGAALAMRRFGARFGLLAAGAAAQLAAVLLLRPHGILFPLILARYLLPVLAVALVALAVLAAALVRPLAARAPAATAAAVAVACGLALVPLGPLPERLTRERVLLGFDALTNFTEVAGDPGTHELPPPYRTKAVAAAAVLAEAPFDLRSATVRPLRWIAKRHGKRVVLVTGHRLARSSRSAFRTVTAAEPEAILASRADALVLHLQLPSEGVAAARWAGRRLRPSESKPLAVQRELAAELERRLIAAWGPPDSRSARFAVWDLRRVRQRQGLSR